MGTFNGHLASLTTSLKGGTSISVVNVSDAVPMKYFKQGFGSVRTTEGVSGSIFVEVMASIGGSTLIIGGCSAITTLGNNVIGFTALQSIGAGFPRPSKVIFGAAGAVGVGFTASVYLAGEY